MSLARSRRIRGFELSSKGDSSTPHVAGAVHKPWASPDRSPLVSWRHLVHRAAPMLPLEGRADVSARPRHHIDTTDVAASTSWVGVRAGVLRPHRRRSGAAAARGSSRARITLLAAVYNPWSARRKDARPHGWRPVHDACASHARTWRSSQASHRHRRQVCLRRGQASPSIRVAGRPSGPKAIRAHGPSASRIGSEASFSSNGRGANRADSTPRGGRGRRDWPRG